MDLDMDAICRMMKSVTEIPIIQKHYKLTVNINKISDLKTEICLLRNSPTTNT